MNDFTLRKYAQYLEAIKSHSHSIITFREFLTTENKPASFCLIRHDVDRRPGNALKMALLESSMGIKSSYYFRIKKNTFIPEILRKIYELGHEVGYHYESLSDTNGNMELALSNFEDNLKKMRAIVPVSTISMHGRPFRKFDNRDLWKNENRYAMLKSKFGLLGELYLDIDYADIAYINDTGRNWTSGKSNARDKVNTKIKSEFQDGNELLNYLKYKPYPKMIFQIHPERWSDNFFEWIVQYAKDKAINLIKFFIKLLRN